MADEKDPPDHDEDVTVFDPDLRRRLFPGDGEDKARPPAANSPPEPEDHTAVIARSAPPAPPPSPDDDRTVIGVRHEPAPSPESSSFAEDRTLVRPTGHAAPRASASGFELVALSGGARGRRYPIGDNAIIGSNASCTVQLPAVDPIHAKIVRREAGYQLQNLGAPSSIAVSGGKSDRAVLVNGDLLKIGDNVLRLVRAGDVFSAEYSESDFEASGLQRVLPGGVMDNPRRLVIVALVVVLALLGVFALVGRQPEVRIVQAPKDDPTARRKEEVAALITSGEVLFNAGKFVAPPDVPDAENAYRTFNRALELDPGNVEARGYLERIDQELKSQQRAREEADARRRELEREREERARRELAERVDKVLAEGDRLFERGNVTEPAGENALARYRDALKIDPKSEPAAQRIRRAVNHHVERGDRMREQNQPWVALENYRKASRASDGGDPEIEARVRETEGRLRGGMTGSGAYLVMYKDDQGKLYVYDEMEKVPAKYRDRAVEVKPETAGAADRGR